MSWVDRVSRGPVAADPFVEEYSREDIPRQDLGKDYLVNHLFYLFLNTAQVRAHLSIPKTHCHLQELLAVDFGGRGPMLWSCLPCGLL